jgi:nitrate reductase NapD
MAEFDRERRRFLTGQAAPPEADYLVSSAVVSAFPERAAAVAEMIATLPGAEVHVVEGSKIVIVLEGRESGEIGARLAQIALMDGVLAANLVYEHVERLTGDDDVSLAT